MTKFLTALHHMYLHIIVVASSITTIIMCSRLSFQRPVYRVLGYLQHTKPETRLVLMYPKVFVDTYRLVIDYEWRMRFS